MSCKELRAELKRRGVTQTGKKEDLIARLNDLTATIDEPSTANLTKLFDALRKQGLLEDSWKVQLQAGIKHGKLCSGSFVFGKKLLELGIHTLSD